MGSLVLHGGAASLDGTLVDVTPRSDRPEGGDSSHASTLPVSREQREALFSLIGICKTDHPPSDEEVERIIAEERMKKYG